MHGWMIGQRIYRHRLHCDSIIITNPSVGRNSNKNTEMNWPTMNKSVIISTNGKIKRELLCSMLQKTRVLRMHKYSKVFWRSNTKAEVRKTQKQLYVKSCLLK